MGWVWKAEPEDSGEFQRSTRKVVQSQCKTEEVEPGRFIRKCQKTEEILRECVGRPLEVLKSNKEYTEEDVTDQVVKGSLPLESSEQAPFEFPGLRNDIEAIERSFIDGLNRFFEAADGMKDEFFNKFDRPQHRDSSFPSMRRGIPIEDGAEKEVVPKTRKPDPDSGHVDLAGMARDV